MQRISGMLSSDLDGLSRASGHVTSASHPNDGTQERAALIHREILQLGVLILVAVAAFFVTRAVAASNRETSLRDAAEWYRRGRQQVEAGHVDDAIDSFRRATVRNRTDRRYVLALAQALALEPGQRRGARRVAHVAGIGPGRSRDQPPTCSTRGRTAGCDGGAAFLSQRAVRAVAG